MANQVKIPKNVYIIVNTQIIPIQKEVTTIGRKLESDLVIQNNLISRSHAEIRFEGGKFVLYDLNSTSGTFINKKKIDKSVLNSGDQFSLANMPMIFIDESDSLTKGADVKTGTLEE
jgi:pSer/pThr/pTyr-binding forkhead associated (FHA) protein